MDVMGGLLVLLWLAVIGRVGGLPPIVKIGGLFDVHDVTSESKQSVAFRYAVDWINDNKSLLNNTKLSGQIEKIPPSDSFHASKRVCHLLRSGVAALFGPESGSTSSHIQSICDAMEIPHIETRWDYLVRRDSYSINLHPSPKLISKAYKSLIQSYGWERFTILYQDNDGLVRLQELLKTDFSRHDCKQADCRQIVVRQLNFKDNDDNKKILREVKQSGEIHLVLDCEQDKIRTVMKEAQAVGMMTAYHNYLITNLDLALVDLEDFKYGGTNITAFRLVDQTQPEVMNVVRTWREGEARRERNFPTDQLIKTETALMYDAVLLFAKALNELDQSQVVTTQPLSCSGEETWQHGNSLVNYMKLVEMEGLTGTVKFDQHGFRTDFRLEIVELKKHGLEKVGTWHDLNGIKFSRNFTETYSEIVESLQNKTLIVTTIKSPPYSMRTSSSRNLVGNAGFEGYAIDLIGEIANILGFNYTFKWVDDGAYGSKSQETGEWNGLMGELLSQKADLAIADLSITYEREKAVDFSNPFMTLGISILYRKPTKAEPNLFAFMEPLNADVWIFIVLAYFIVSFLLFILARFSPYEWDNPHPCNEQEVLVNEFSLLNTMWFAVGSLMQQGSDIVPKSVSTRIIATMWWLFILVVTASYTANLAAFLTVERMESPIESAEDLAKQTKIKYGCVGSGSTRAFFRDSKMPTFARMHTFMESQNTSTSSNNDGVRRVIESEGEYAFLMESNSIEYQVGNPKAGGVGDPGCDLVQVGKMLDSKGYGIAFTPGSQYRVPISSAILKLQEKGRLHILKDRWWKEKRGGGNCEDSNKKTEANELSMDSVGGVFVVLIGGMGVACLLSVLEYLCKGDSLERKSGVKTSSLVAKALTNTNSNIFNIAGIVEGQCKHVQDPSQNHPSLRPPAQRLGPPDHPGGQHRARPHTVRARKGATVGEPRGEVAVGDLPLYTQSSAGDTLRRTNTPGVGGRPLTPGCVSLHPYLDLGDTGVQHLGDPYGPMSGANLASSMGNITAAELEPKGLDSCGPLSKHSYCDLHCQSKHITYSSPTNCFTALDC